MTVYGYWIEDALSEARAMGIRGRWVDVDRLSLPAYVAEVQDAATDPAWRLIWHHEWVEARLFDPVAFRAWVVPSLEWLRDSGLVARIDAVQFSDEFWSRLSHFGTPLYHAGWPSFKGRSPAECWGMRSILAAQWGQRMGEYRALWQAILGTPCPMIGTAETGGVVPPTFPSQEWWSLNIYQTSRSVASQRAVQAIYAQAWAFTGLPIQVVLPIYTDAGRTAEQIPTVWHLGLTYAHAFKWQGRDYPAIIDHPQTWSVGVFCVRWPGEDDPVHGEGAGLTRLDPSYAEGVRWLADHLQGR